MLILTSLKRSHNYLTAFPSLVQHTKQQQFVGTFFTLCVRVDELPMVLRLSLRYLQQMFSYSTHILHRNLLWSCVLFYLPATELCWGRSTGSHCRWLVCAYSWSDSFVLSPLVRVFVVWLPACATLARALSGNRRLTACPETQAVDFSTVSLRMQRKNCHSLLFLLLPSIRTNTFFLRWITVPLLCSYFSVNDNNCNNNNNAEYVQATKNLISGQEI